MQQHAAECIRCIAMEKLAEATRQEGHRLRTGEEKVSEWPGEQSASQAGVPDGYGNHRTCSQAPDHEEHKQNLVAFQCYPFIAYPPKKPSYG